MSRTLTTSDAACASVAEASGAVAVSNWMGWAAFLAASWTWCIGMWLPHLLVRDYGALGWIVFAVPNVIGAGAMGWVLRSATTSVTISTAHRTACRMFSAVTIAFHLFFVVAVVAPLALSIKMAQGHALDLALGGTLFAAVLLYVYITHRRDGDRVLAVVVLAISLVAMGFVAMEIEANGAMLPERLHPLAIDLSPDLLWLAPVCMFGFMACPYLDLTFHRARQQSARPRASFGWGFGVLFLSMITFTLIYSRVRFEDGGITTWIAVFLFVHMSLQSAFTMVVHARELRHDHGMAATVAAVLTLAALGALWWPYFAPYPLGNSLRIGEIIYRSFMGFYGLIFPAYVWIVMLPRAGAPPVPTRRAVSVFTIAVLMALPMFWMGFVMGQMIWLAPGMAIVLLARLATGRSRTNYAIDANS